MKDPEFLTLAEVLDIHHFQIERHGGSLGVRDQGLLESALAIPQSSFDGQFLYSSLFAMAAAYAYHIAENQPFIDGNKRAALGAALVFLDMNGVSIEDPNGSLYDAMMAIARWSSLYDSHVKREADGRNEEFLSSFVMEPDVNSRLRECL